MKPKRLGNRRRGDSQRSERERGERAVVPPLIAPLSLQSFPFFLSLSLSHFFTEEKCIHLARSPHYCHRYYTVPFLPSCLLPESPTRSRRLLTSGASQPSFNRCPQFASTQLHFMKLLIRTYAMFMRRSIEKMHHLQL